MIYLIAMITLLVSMGLVLVRGLLGPSTYDRILAVNSFGTITVLAIAILSFLFDEPSYIDMALLYGLINFISTIALLRYFKDGGFNRE